MRDPTASDAYRARGGIIGALASCTCLYPLVRYESSTEHRGDCQAHNVLLFLRQQAGEDVPERPIAAVPFSSWREPGGGFRGRCTVCGDDSIVAANVLELAASFAGHQHRSAP